MIAQSEQKKMLIESMKKLTNHVSGNLHRQREIFQALSLQDFNKIIANLRDENQYLRRISALLLCELFYRNEQTKNGLVALLDIQPGWGRICLGGIPDTICKYPSTLKKCVELMRADVLEDEDDKICWIINLERKSLKVQQLQYKKYSSFTFIDPVKNIFGLTIRNPNAKKDTPNTKTTVQMNFKSPHVPESLSHRFPETQEKPKSHTQNMKNFTQGRQRESFGPVAAKNAFNMTIDLHDARRASMSGTSSTQYRNQLPGNTTAKKIDLNASLEIKPLAGEVNKSKYDYNRSYKLPYQVSPKISMGSPSPNESIYANSYTHSSSYQAEMNDKGGSRFGNGSGNANGVAIREPVNGEQERFYRRVKDILKK